MPGAAWAAGILTILTAGCARSGATGAVRLTSLPGDEGPPVFSRDGSLIAFTAEPDGGGSDIAWLDVGTGRIRWLTTTPAVREEALEWSADGRALLYRAAGRIVRTDLADGITRELVPAAMNGLPGRLSPDGTRLAFVTRAPSGSAVWTVAPDGSLPPVRIGTLDVLLLPAGWTADGASLLGSVPAAGSQDLFAFDLATATLRRLTDHPDEEWTFRPAPAGDWAAFYSTWGDDMTDVRVVHTRTGETRRLTSAAAEDFGPDWSPDGRRLVFLSDRISKSGLWVVDVESGLERPLLPRERADGFPRWSPAGTHVAFQKAAALERLYRVPSRGGPVEPVGPDSLDLAGPVAAPDGRRLVLETMGLGSEGDLALLDLVSGRLTALTRTVENIGGPSWSPDGAWLAIRRNRGGWFRTAQVGLVDPATGRDTVLTTMGWIRSLLWCGDHLFLERPPAPDRTAGQALWRMPAAGGAPQLVLPGPATPRDCRADGAILYSTRETGRPVLRWLTVGRDGKPATDSLAVEHALTGRAARDGRIAYLAVDGGRTDLFVVDPAAGSRVRLTDTPWVESTPAWSPDGTWIYFSARPGDIDLWWAPISHSLR